MLMLRVGRFEVCGWAGLLVELFSLGGSDKMD